MGNLQLISEDKASDRRCGACFSGEMDFQWSLLPGNSLFVSFRRVKRKHALGCGWCHMASDDINAHIVLNPATKSPKVFPGWYIYIYDIFFIISTVSTVMSNFLASSLYIGCYTSKKSTTTWASTCCCGVTQPDLTESHCCRRYLKDTYISRGRWHPEKRLGWPYCTCTPSLWVWVQYFRFKLLGGLMFSHSNDDPNDRLKLGIGQNDQPCKVANILYDLLG